MCLSTILAVATLYPTQFSHWISMIMEKLSPFHILWYCLRSFAVTQKAPGTPTLRNPAPTPARQLSTFGGLIAPTRESATPGKILITSMNSNIWQRKNWPKETRWLQNCWRNRAAMCFRPSPPMESTRGVKYVRLKEQHPSTVSSDFYKKMP